MAKAKTWKAPYFDGSLRHDAPWRARDADEIEWRQPRPFRVQAMYYQGFARGHSAAYLKWSSDNGYFYPMFLTDLDTVLRTQDLTCGLLFDRWWIECKRGRNYGIRLATPDEIEGDENATQ